MAGAGRSTSVGEATTTSVVGSTAAYRPRALEPCDRRAFFLAVIAVKGHNRNIFRKLQVRRRTEVIAHARELGLL